MPQVIKAVLVMLGLILLCVIVVDNAAAAGLPAETSSHVPVIQATRNQSEVARIVSVLERRIGSHRLPMQAKEKLDRMPEKDIQLVASLCDRMAAAHDRAGTDLALLLATVLIVLS